MFKASAPNELLYKITLKANTHFHNQCFQLAEQEYTRALEHVHPNKTQSPDFVALLFANRSACHCMLKNWVDALRDADIAVRICPTWAKGHYRRGEALLGLTKYQAALDSYEVALNLDANLNDAKIGINNAHIKFQDEESGLLIQQLLCGKDLAFEKSYTNLIRNKVFDFAKKMRNFIYIISDVQTRECVVIDACWDVAGIEKIIIKEKLKLIGAIVTHHHFDHVGGTPPPPFDQLPIKVAGLATILKKYPNVNAYIHPEDVATVLEKNPGIKISQIQPTPDGYQLRLSTRVVLRFLHTPGHTMGSQCVLVNDCRVFTGDTLFLGCCGRVDLDDGDPEFMYESLRKMKTVLDNEVVVYPGHAYGGGNWTTIGQEKLSGALRDLSKENWLRKYASKCHDNNKLKA